MGWGCEELEELKGIDVFLSEGDQDSQGSRLECYEGTVLRCSWDDRSGQVPSGGLNVSRQIILFIRQV